MLVLGVETSCDETAASVVKNGSEILSNIILSQEIHSDYGGVVPELASRIHITEIVRIVEKALAKANVGLDDLDGMAVTHGPGLVGCLLVGLSFIKSVSQTKKIPFIGVNHLEGHIFAAKLNYPEISTPHIALVASGGHSNLYLVKDWGDYVLLGSTRDDAPGEAFDKISKLLKLGYPGGPAIEKIAAAGDPKFIDFPRAMKGSRNFEFSFSGLKTAVLVYLHDKSPDFIVEHIPDIAASFQEAVAEVLAVKTINAAKAHNINQISIGGGVARNQRLREIFDERKPNRTDVFLPSPDLCSDNGAMIAACGTFYLKNDIRSDISLNAVPYLEL